MDSLLTIPAGDQKQVLARTRATVTVLVRVLLPVLLCIGTGAASASLVKIQPIEVCNYGGTVCATTGLFTEYSSKIWAQADIALEFLPFQTVNDTDRLFENNFDDLGPNANPQIVNLWFVNTLINCGASVYSVYGCGTADGWFAMTQEVFDYSAVGRVDTLAHELGHVLGLGHDDFGAGGADNLLTAGGNRGVPQQIGDVNPDGLKLDKLTAEQIAETRASPFVTPTPGTLALVALALGALYSVGRQRAS